jgi:DNA polymerase-3 subunit delta'
MIEHQRQWEQIKSFLFNQRVPQAMLFVGSLHCGLNHFTSKVIKMFLCKAAHPKVPCSECSDCQMADCLEHPDAQWVRPEKIGRSIKIEQVRELQHSVFITPQRSRFRLIILDAAERMNAASANALLKILEEPPQHTVFILIAQQMSTVLPTILSRCQLMKFSSPEDMQFNNLLQLGEQHLQQPEKAVMAHSEAILDGLISILEGKEHPCILAAQWTHYELTAILWYLYLVYAQIQQMHFNKSIEQGPVLAQLKKLVFLVDPVKIFIQIDEINSLTKRLNQNININPTLALEHLLFLLSS